MAEKTSPLTDIEREAIAWAALDFVARERREDEDRWQVLDDGTLQDMRAAGQDRSRPLVSVRVIDDHGEWQTGTYLNHNETAVIVTVALLDRDWVLAAITATLNAVERARVLAQQEQDWQRERDESDEGGTLATPDGRP